MKQWHRKRIGVFLLVTAVFAGCFLFGARCALAAEEATGFTEEEQKLITDGTEITVGFLEQMEPLAYVDADGTYKGIYVDLINRAKEKTGINIRLCPIKRDEDWKELVQNGTIDFYIGSSETISRKDTFLSTKSFMEYRTVLITKSNYDYYAKTRPVLGLTRARAYWDENMPPNFKNARLVYFKTARDCLFAVKSGEVDATILNTYEFNYQTKNKVFSELVQWENYRFDSGTSMAASRNIDPVKFSLMNKAMATLRKSEVSEITSLNINMPYVMVDLLDYIYPARNILVLILMFIIVLTAAMLVIRRIRKTQNQVLEEKERRERRQLRIMAALSYEYNTILYVNLDEDSYMVVETTRQLRQEVAEQVGRLQSHSGLNEWYTKRFVDPEYQELIRGLADKEALLAHFREKQDFSVRYRVKENPDNQEYFEAHLVDVSEEEDGHFMIIGFRCVDEIVREEAEQRKALQEAFDAANRANYAKSDFLSNMSHDIRTPMNAIIGMTAIAVTHIDDKDRVLDALGKISSSSRHLLALINEVLDMSKIESGKINLNEEEFKLSDLLNNLLIMVQPQIKKHEHNLQVRIMDIQHEDVIGDSLRIQQVFVNIMSNAVKYTPDHGNISLTVMEKPINKRRIGCYEFIFEDDGIGMSKEFLEHIFEPFSRAEDGRTSKIQGTGLGMAITRNIVRMMNGDIQVESEEGKGSKFTITIYLKLQEKEDINIEDLSGIPVLVVDDDQYSCEGTCKMLDEIGMNSEWALSGEEAVARVKLAHEEGRDYYAIILDWQMPGMNGIQTARKIKKIIGSEVPVIILSAYDWSDIEMEARAAGVDRFLSKPVFKSGFARMFRRMRNGDMEQDERTDTDIGIEGDFSGKRVLLVEDNELNREIATEILKTMGIEIDEAENGKEAVDKFSASEKGYYDMILMDVQMPVMNGYDATSAIRSLDRPDAMHVPIIAMTANAFAEDVQAAKSSGMNEHLAKPFDIAKIKEVLGKYLG